MSRTLKLAALLALIYTLYRQGPSDAERNAQSGWDLTKYKPKPRTW
jgi:hypothetical protein